MKNRPVYVHYGHKKFDKALFESIKNRAHFIKPSGGFWASRTDAKYGWKEWNESSEFVNCDDNFKISFFLSDNARVLEIHNVEDAKKMKKTHEIKDELSEMFNVSFLQTIDFEKMKENYDAVELFISDDSKLYNELYGWDCDSILILNPDVVEEIDLEHSVADDILGNETENISFESFDENDLEK